MAIKQVVTCSRCGATEPVTLRSRISVRRLSYSDTGFLAPTIRRIDLCESCWKDFEEFVYKYKE